MNCGDIVKFVSIPNNVPPEWLANKTIGVGVTGVISRLNSLQNGYAEVLLKGHHTAHVPLECLSVADPDKITPESTVRVSSVQNISIDVLGEGRSITVPANEVIDIIENRDSLKAISASIHDRVTSDLSTISAMLSQFPRLDSGESDYHTLQHIRFMAGVASELTAISGLIAEHQSDTMPF